LDRQSGPQGWTMAGQLIGFGMEYAAIPYPYSGGGIGDPSKVPSLTYPNLDLGTLVPGTLQSCDLSADGKTALFHIRPGVKAWNGDELTSADVMWGVERSVSLKGIGAFFLAAGNAANFDQWKAIDKYTVQVTSDTPMAMVCKLNAHLFYAFGKSLDSTEAKKHATPDDPWATQWLSTNDASFGPYHITNWQAGKQVVMEANPNYWKGPSKIKRIIWQVVPESASRVALLQAGKVDLAEGLSPEEASSLNGSPGVNVAALRSNQEFFIVYDNSKPPFNDPRVRQAINYAIPRDDIVKSIYRGLATSWDGVIPEIYPGFVKYGTYQYDLEKAKQLLAEAGYANGFAIPLAYNSGDPVQEQVAVLLQSSLQKINVSATLKKMPPAAMSDYVQSGKAEFAFWVDAPFLPDPNFSLRVWYRTGIASDWENYSNPTVDSQIDACNLVVDWSKRLECHKPIQDAIHADAPHGWVASPYFIMAMRSDLAGWAWNPALTYSVYGMSVIQ
jgi:peptide/nickel transport system substrate-binding protein